jgi:serine protease Do
MLRANAKVHAGIIMATDLQNLSNELAATVERAAASIVAVHARRGIGSSGIAWRDNLILTSSEGVRAEEGIKLLLPDGRVATARLRGRDSGTDLAVLETDASGLRPLEFSGDKAFKAGQLAIAVGRTANTGPIASFGIVSGVSGEWKTWRGGKLDPFVRLDISAYPTLSGGAALDAGGNLIGLVSTGLSRSSVFAVTGSTIDRIAGKLSQQGYVSRGFLGVALQPVALPPAARETLKQDTGIMLLGIEPEGPARSSNSKCCGRAWCRIWKCESESGPGAGDSKVNAPFGDVVEKLRRSTVQVGRGGSGVIWSRDGKIVTNAHVVEGAGRSGVVDVELWDGRRLSGEILRTNRRRDLAVLQVESSGLPAAVAGDSNSLRVGELVIAVGNPLGFIGAASTGVVHKVDNRSWVVSQLRLAPGNSGGPLADARGEVVGINTMIAGGLAFAIPSDSVTQFLARLPIRRGASAHIRAVGVQMAAATVRAA